HTGADVVTCDFGTFNRAGALPSTGLPPLPRGLSFAEALMLGNCVSGGSAVLVKTAKIRNHGGFDATLCGCEDWDMWRRLAWDSEFHYVDRALVKYRRHDTNMTGNLPLNLQAESQHFAKLLAATPPKLRHMLPAAQRRYFRVLLHNLTEQGVTDTWGVLFYNMFFAAYRLLNKMTGGLPRRIYRSLRGAAGQGMRRQSAGLRIRMRSLRLTPRSPSSLAPRPLVFPPSPSRAGAAGSACPQAQPRAPPDAGVDVSVVARAQWVPPGLAHRSPRWAAYQRLPRNEPDGRIPVERPRYIPTPRETRLGLAHLT